MLVPLQTAQTSLVMCRINPAAFLPMSFFRAPPWTAALFWWCALKLLPSSVEIRLRLEQLLDQALMHPVSWSPRLLRLSSRFSDDAGVMGPGQVLSEVNSEGSEAVYSLHCRPVPVVGHVPHPAASCSRLSALWFRWWWVRGRCPGTRMSEFWPPLCTPSRLRQWWLNED